MVRVCTSVCLAAGVSTAAAAFAQPPSGAAAGERNPVRDATVTGCVAPASQPDQYIISIFDDRDAARASAGGIPAGTPLRLVGLPPRDFQDYVGQQVEVFGMVLPDRSSRGHGDGRGRGHETASPTAASRLNVRSIRQIAPSCAAPVPAATVWPGMTSAPEKHLAVAHDGDGGRSRGTGRDNGRATRAAAIPVATTPAAPPAGVAANPTAGTGTANGTAPVSGTRPTPGPTAPPTNSTTANAGLGQSGISGSATLGGSVSMTPPTFVFGQPRPGAIPAGATPSSTPAAGSATAPAAGNATAPSTGSATPPAAGSVTAPGAGSATAAAAGTAPALTSPPTNAQGASNTTTSNAALDQFGLSGDALLSGLVNVNVQQLLESV